MKSKFSKTLSLILAAALLLFSTGCYSSLQNQEGNVVTFDDFSSVDTLEYIRNSVEDDLQETLDGYEVDYVECVYISQEYIDELNYNSLSNVYYGYEYADVIANMDGINWTFGVDENGETVVTEVQNPSIELGKIITKVAIGTGVILICVVLSASATAVGAKPVACFFAGAAKGAIEGAITGGSIGGLMGGTIAGIENQSWDAALAEGLETAADGFMWGAIAGAIKGGMTSKACFTADTMVKTIDGYKPIFQIVEGDFVYSFDETSKEYSYCPVVDVMQRTVNEIYVINIGDATIETTKNHPFYTTDGWIEAQYLTENSFVFSNGEFVKIHSVDIVERADTAVWNLNIAFNHTYTVSEIDVVVHNSCASDAKKLRENLIDKGVPVPDYKNAAHHIVPSNSNNTYAVRARELLKKLGIDINDADNGVFLATEANIPGTTYHRTLHTDAYFKKVWDILGNSKSKSDAIEALKFIGEALQKGMFMP